MKKILKKIVYSLPSSKVVIFHHVTDIPLIQNSGCLLKTELFEKYIDSNHSYDTLDNVIQHSSRQKIAITFDDGLEDLYTIAYPFLRLRNIPFTAFIVTDFLDRPGYITKQQLIEMSNDPLVSIGSHGISHDIFPKMTREQKKHELIASKEILEELIGKKVNNFAYSHGQYDKETISLMKGLYNYGFEVRDRVVNFCTIINKKKIPRYNIDNTTIEKWL